MALYEHTFLTRQDVTSQQVEALTEQFQAVLTANGGTVAKNEYWGVKSLAYRIRKNRKAHFSHLCIDAPAAAIAEMERQMSINEDILRFMTIRVEAIEEGPSAMLRRRDEGDRREREDDFGGGRGFGGGGRGGFGGRDGAPRRRRDDDMGDALGEEI